MSVAGCGADFPVLLAPMAGVTDRVYRNICKRFGCDLAFSEMVSAKGLCYENLNTFALLEPDGDGKPTGVQLFGSDPDFMEKAALLLCKRMGTDIAVLDINMGCPAKKIVKNGDGSALMQDPARAQRVAAAAVRAAKRFNIPVSVKLRSGYDASHINAVEVALRVQDAGAAGVTVHGRTREQMYSGHSDWDIIAEVKRALSIPVTGNGDVFSGADAAAMYAHTGCDGIMVARGALGAPYIFSEIKAAIAGTPYTPPTQSERLDMAIAHAQALMDAYGEHGGIEMRKHVAWYVRGIHGAAALRLAVNSAQPSELVQLLERAKYDLYGA